MVTQDTTVEYKVGDLVMFRNRTQTCSSGMRIEEVDTNMFDTQLKVNGLWWVPGNVMPLDQWRARFN